MFGKISTLFKNTLQVLNEECGVNNDFDKDFKKIINCVDKNDTTMWKMPQSYHITLLFIGGNKSCLTNPIYTGFKEYE